MAVNMVLQSHSSRTVDVELAEVEEGRQVGQRFDLGPHLHCK